MPNCTTAWPRFTKKSISAKEKVMLKKLAIAVGVEWFAGLVGLSLAGASLSLVQSVVLLGVLAGANVAAVKISDVPSAG